MSKGWIDPREVKSQTAGTLFLIGRGEQSRFVFSDESSTAPNYHAVFIRVRVVMGQINVEDVEHVAAFARKLLNANVPFISFSAGRDCPFPEYQGDLDEFMGDLKQGVQSLRRVN